MGSTDLQRGTSEYATDGGGDCTGKYRERMRGEWGISSSGLLIRYLLRVVDRSGGGYVRDACACNEEGTVSRGMTLPSQRNRALRGMGDDSTQLTFFGSPSPVAAPVYSDPGFDVCDTSTSNCTSAQTVLTPAQLASLSAANTAVNINSALNQVATPTTTTTNPLLWIVLGSAAIFMFASKR
jgi:hypothetical protein